MPEPASRRFRKGMSAVDLGHVWAFATHEWLFSEEEMAARMSG